MTPTEQDKELREHLVETILSILGVMDRSSGNRPGQIATLEQKIASYITADRKRVELEARIDELKKIEIGGDNIWTVDSGTDTAMLIEERIAELKAKLEEV